MKEFWKFLGRAYAILIVLMVFNTWDDNISFLNDDNTTVFGLIFMVISVLLLTLAYTILLKDFKKED
jgi:hypothetical protein